MDTAPEPTKKEEFVVERGYGASNTTGRIDYPQALEMVYEKAKELEYEFVRLLSDTPTTFTFLLFNR